MRFVLYFNCQEIMKSVEFISIIIVKLVLCQFKLVAYTVLQALGQVYVKFFIVFICIKAGLI